MNPKEKPARKKTQYQVLERRMDSWHELGTCSANNAEQAVRAFVAEAQEHPPVMVAVPLKSFRPVEVRSVQQTRTVLDPFKRPADKVQSDREA